MTDIWKLDQEYQRLRIMLLMGRIKSIDIKPVPFLETAPTQAVTSDKKTKKQ